MSKKKKLFEIFEAVLDEGSGSISIHSKASDFDSWDSVAVINLAMAVEEEFELTLTAEDEDIEGFQSVGFVAELVTRAGVNLE